MSYFGVSLRNGASLGLGTVPALSNPPLLYRLAPSLLLQFAGAETLDSRVTFTRTTTATRTNSSGLIESVAINGPRFDYNPTTLAPNGLLIEEQRVNLILQSQDFTTTWAANNVTVTANTQVAPDGTTTAETLDDDVANAVHDVNQAIVTTSGLTYTLSAFLKNGTRQFAILACSGSATSYASAKFDLSAGTLGSTTASGASWSVVSSSITSVGNSWYRCTITFVVGTTTGTAARIGMATNGTTFTASQRGLEVYTGTDATIFAWGAQLEAGAFPTSYIPTVASQVTRTADVATMTGTNFSSWYNATEGTMYAEGILNNTAVTGAQTRRLVDINDNTANNRITMGRGATAAVARFIYTVSGTNLNGANGQTIAGVFPSAKLAVAFKAGDYACSGNGSAATTSTAASVPVVDRLSIGNDAAVTANSAANGTIKRIAFYPRRLTNAELQAITS